MTIRFHPEDATLLSYAAGALSEPFAILVASHAEMCSACRRRLGAMNALGGAIASVEPFAALDADALARVLDRLDAPGAPAGARLPAAPTGRVDLPRPLARLVGGGLDAIAWRTLTPGAEDRIYRFAARGGGQALRFLRAAPGQEIPEHGHAGAELTLVLRGGLRDGERIHWRGEVTDISGPASHTPVAHGDETCVCVIAEEGPPRFRSAAMRELQQRIGI